MSTTVVKKPVTYKTVYTQKHTANYTVTQLSHCPRLGPPQAYTFLLNKYIFSIRKLVNALLPLG